MKYEIFFGEKSLMEKISREGVKALNPKTMNWEVIDNDAQYSVKEDFKGDVTGATLLCNLDLNQIAKKKGLII